MNRRGPLIVLTIFLLATACSGSSVFPMGAGTASITWRRVGGSPGVEQPYSGSIAGQSLRGQAVIPQPTSFTNLILGKWTGTFENKTFSLTVSAVFPNGLGSLSSGTSPTLRISGSYGTWQVSGSATEVGSSNVARVSGTVGSHHVSGTISITEKRNTASATAHFIVS